MSILCIYWFCCIGNQLIDQLIDWLVGQSSVNRVSICEQESAIASDYPHTGF